MTKLILYTLLMISTTAQAMPKQCQQDCKTPYGTELGMAANGVKAFSNCSAKCVIFDPNKMDGVYTGIKWQCVEYARRWLLKEYGKVYGDVDYAFDIWDKIKDIHSPKDREEKISLQNIENGKILSFKRGDLVIYSKAYMSTGHVAVVVEMSDKTEKDPWIRVAEENYLNKKWPGQYAREIKLKKTALGYSIEDKYVLGIKRSAAQTK